MTPIIFGTDEAMVKYCYLQPHLEDGIALAQTVKDSGVSERTLRRWLAAYRKNGLQGLARQPRSDRNKRRKLNIDFENLIKNQIAQQPRLPLTVIHRRVSELAKERGVEAPSYALIADIARKIPAPSIALISNNTKEFRDQYEIVHRRESGKPNEMWQADHTWLDIELLDEHARKARPWLTFVIDDYSRAIAGYYLSFDPPSAINTALALRQAIWHKEDPDWLICGIPEILYVDNGRDFISAHIKQACAALKIRLIHSMPGRPRGRGRIERLFRTFNDMFLAELPGFLKEGKSQSRPALTIEELTEKLEIFLHGTYHRKNHGTTGEPPSERWAAGGFLPNMPETLQVLDMLLLHVNKSRKVQRDGIRFQGKRYMDPMLAAFVGEQVEVLYDPRHLSEIHIYHDGEFICRAFCSEHADAPDLKDIITARRRYKQSAKQQAGKGQQESRSSALRRHKSNLKLYIHED